MATAQKTVSHFGLTEGAIHAEMRINDKSVWLIELASRSIGGNCARTLKTRVGKSLEEQILLNALGENSQDFEDGSIQSKSASAVMMIPIPRAGILRTIKGLSRAKSVEGVIEITINIALGQKLVPVPEGNRYLGFIFAEAKTPAIAESIVRSAHGLLEFSIEAISTD